MQAPPKRKSEEEETSADAKVVRNDTLQSGESLSTAPIGFECALQTFLSLSNASLDLDHTADIQIHGWGPRLEVAMEQVAVGMFNYISELKQVAVDASCTGEVDVTGHDMQSLLYEFLTEMLMLFCIDKLICKEVQILEFDRAALRIKAIGKGEKWNRSKHSQGTEIKAITYSAMQIHEKEGRAEVYVIVDI